MLKRKRLLDEIKQVTAVQPPLPSVEDEESDNETTEISQKPNKIIRKADNLDVSRYVNKQRVLILSSRGTTGRDRHFMSDLRDLLVHCKKDVKMDAKDKLTIVNEIAEMKNCNNTIFLEARKHKDLYMWMSKTPNGPSVKFLVQNLHTMAEVKMTGNCLKGSRPILSFDATFDSTPHYRLLKEIFIQTFGAPKGHPKVKPFIDHVFSFFITDHRIWFRNYQIVYETEQTSGKKDAPVLVEIGPRFVLNPVRIFSGSFVGSTLWENPNYTSPNALRSLIAAQKGNKYVQRTERIAKTIEHRENSVVPEHELEKVFQ